MVRVNLGLAMLLSRTNKDFICYDLKDNKIINYKLTNDLHRYKNKYSFFRCISTIQIENRIIN